MIAAALALLGWTGFVATTKVATGMDKEVLGLRERLSESGANAVFYQSRAFTAEKTVAEQKATIDIQRQVLNEVLAGRNTAERAVTKLHLDVDALRIERDTARGELEQIRARKSDQVARGNRTKAALRRAPLLIPHFASAENSAA
jgi:hypothetical protein